MSQDLDEVIGAQEKQEAGDILHANREMVSPLGMERTEKKKVITG